MKKRIALILSFIMLVVCICAPSAFAKQGDHKSTYKKVFGRNALGFASSSGASSHMTTVKVKVWKMSGKKKVKSTISIKVNSALADNVKEIFDEIFESDEKFPIYALEGFASRGNKRSEHHWGTAIDINPNENYFVSGGKRLAGSFWDPKKSKYSIAKDSSVVKAFEKHGWYWGGDGWGDRKDYMHFSYYGT